MKLATIANFPSLIAFQSKETDEGGMEFTGQTVSLVMLSVLSGQLMSLVYGFMECNVLDERECTSHIVIMGTSSSFGCTGREGGLGGGVQLKIK